MDVDIFTEVKETELVTEGLKVLQFTISFDLTCGAHWGLIFNLSIEHLQSYNKNYNKAAKTMHD